MDFESPDVEKEFPGLYGSDAARKSNESDFSDDGGHDKISKKELLGGKRKDKKDRKDRGYAALEGESSPDEEETKSPSKSKKTKTFKFPTKKEKREKSREKDVKEKDSDKDKKKKDKDEKEADKERRKEKSKLKLKDRKKSKHGEDGFDIGDEQPIFGVPLKTAVERSRCHDGVELPLVVRDCINYVQVHGMSVEGLYKVPGVKSKVQHLKKLYSQRENVNLSEYEITAVTSLLSLFLRELPEPVLENSEMITRFEQAASAKDLTQREVQLSELVNQLPEYNRVLLAWITLHLDHIATWEKTTKMNAQTIAMTLSPVLQMSHRLLLALLCHCKALFPNVQLTKYIPPLSSVGTLPDTADKIAAELSKQESLLSQIHMLMHAGYVTKSREEQLWEVQRIITQLKRKYKSVQKLESMAQKSLDEEIKSSDEHFQNDCRLQRAKASSVEDAGQPKIQMQTLTDKVSRKNINFKSIEIPKETKAPLVEAHNILPSEQDAVDASKAPVDVPSADTTCDKCTECKTEEAAAEVEDPLERLRECLIYEEMLNVKASLMTRILQERHEIDQLTEVLAERCTEKPMPVERNHSPTEAEMTAMIQLIGENQLLEKKMTTLVRSIVEEKEACVELRVQLALHQFKK